MPEKTKICCKPIGEICFGNETDTYCGNCGYWLDTRIKKSIWDILKNDYGFIEVETHEPINIWHAILYLFMPKLVKYKSIIHQYWLTNTIGKNKYEVYISDIWYIQVKKNDVIIFDAKHYTNDEILSIIEL